MKFLDQLPRLEPVAVTFLMIKFLGRIKMCDYHLYRAWNL